MTDWIKDDAQFWGLAPRQRYDYDTKIRHYRAHLSGVRLDMESRKLRTTMWWAVPLTLVSVAVMIWRLA